MLELQQTGWGWETGMVHTSIIVPLQEIKKKKEKKKGKKAAPERVDSVWMELHFVLLAQKCLREI